MAYTSTIPFRESLINNFINNIKKKNNDFIINEKMYSNITNLIPGLLEQNAEFANQLNNFKILITPIYKNLNEFFFNFYKEFTKEIYYTIYNIKIDDSKKAKEMLNEIMINITKECDYFKSDLSDTDITLHKNKIDQYLDAFNKTLIDNLAMDIKKLAPKFVLSEQFWTKFNNSKNELINSFKALKQNRSLIFQYPEEIDYIIESLESFKNESNQVFEKINHHINIAYTLITKITPYYQNITSYISSNQMFIVNYINKTLKLNEYFDIEELNTYFEELKDLASLLTPSYQFYEAYENYTFITEEISNELTTSIQDIIDQISIYRDNLYNYFHGINCDTDGCSNSNETTEEKNKNQFIRTRLEMLISYMKLYTQKLNETYDEEDFNTLLLYDFNYEDIIDKNFIFNELNIKTYDYMENTIDNLYNEIDTIIENIKDVYNEVNYTDIMNKYEDIVNNVDENFLNYTKSKIETCNSTIHSLINQYNTLLYKYINGYNYSIISFDKFQNYFNNYTSNIIDKFNRIKNKIEILKGTLINKSIYDGNINMNFTNNITSLFNERKSYIINLLNNTDFDYETKIFDKDFKLKDAILELIFNDDENNLKEINDSLSLNISGFIDTISELISNIDYPIKNVLTNYTDVFLQEFKNRSSLNKTEEENLFNIYKNEYELPNNTENRKCWNFRGFFFTEIVKDDQINYEKYLDYLNKTRIIEECEATGNNYCPFSRSELEVIEYVNNTELYFNCYNRKKIYGKKQSIFYTIEDFDVEQFNSINNRLMNVFDELFSFENFISDYIYSIFGLDEYKTIQNVTLNLENITTEIMDKVNESINNNVDKYINYMKDNLIGSVSQIEEKLYRSNYEITKDSIVLFANLKNRLFINHYNKNYKKLEGFYINLINNLTNITTSFKKTLINTFSDIEERQDEYNTSNWEKMITRKFDDYYATFSPTKYITPILDTIKNKINKEEDVLTLIKENIDIILNNTSSDDEFLGIGVIFNQDLTSYKFESMALMPLDDSFDYEGETVVKEIEEILERLNLVEYDEKGNSVIDSYQKIKDKYFGQTNFEYKENDLENKMENYIQEIINNTYDLNDNLDDIIDQKDEIEMPILDYEDKIDIFSIAFNQSYDYYQKILPQINDNFNNLVQSVYTLSLYNNTDEIDAKFGEFMGYALINGLSYMDPPCPNNKCAFQIDMLKEKSKLSRRRLEETRKEVKEIVGLLRDLRDINKNDFFADYEIKSHTNNSLRNLGLKTDSEYEQIDNYIKRKSYSSKDIGLEQRHVEYKAEMLKRKFEQLNENFYIIATKLQKEIDEKFKDELKALENKYNQYLSQFSKILSKDDYVTVEEYMTDQLYQINYYFNKMTSGINSITEIHLDKINNIYCMKKIGGSMISNKISDYYNALTILIESKYKIVTESDYNRANSLKNNKNLVQGAVDQTEKLMVQTLKTEAKAEKELKSESKDIFGWTEGNATAPIKDEIFSNYGWDDNDNFNNKPDPDSKDKKSYFAKTKKDDTNKKEKDTTKEREKSKFEKKTEKIQKELDELHINIETEIKLDFFKGSFAINNNFAIDNTQDISAGWQYPFAFPAFPIAQFRIGIKVAAYFRYVFGLMISLSLNKENGFGVEVMVYAEIYFGLKLDIIGEIGLYGGIASIYGGIAGTILDAKFQIKLQICYVGGYIDAFMSLSLNALQFRVYVETQVKILWWKVKIVLLEKTFGLTQPLLNIYLYTRKNFAGQRIDGDKKLHVDSIFK